MINDFVLFNSMAVNRNEILAVIPQYDEEKNTFRVLAVSKSNVPLELFSGIKSYDEAVAYAHKTAKIFEVGVIPQQPEQNTESVKAPAKKAVAKKPAEEEPQQE